MSEPLVSVVMATHNRRRWLPMALVCFLRQTYLNCELLVIDDGDDYVYDLMPGSDRVRYLLAKKGMTIGEKMNRAIGKHARGDIITFLDDDDWMAEWRIEDQVSAMQRYGSRMCGSDRMWFWDLCGRRTWKYNADPGRPPQRWVNYVVGASMMFERSVWEERPFVESGPIFADTEFVRYRPEPWLNHMWTGSYVAMIHPGNTSPKQLQGAEWQMKGDEDIAMGLIGADDAQWFMNLREELWP